MSCYLWWVVTCDELLHVMSCYLWWVVTCDELLPVMSCYLWWVVTCDELLPVVSWPCSPSAFSTSTCRAPVMGWLKQRLGVSTWCFSSLLAIFGKILNIWFNPYICGLVNIYMKIHGVHIVSLLGYRATILRYCILFYMSFFILAATFKNHMKWVWKDLKMPLNSLFVNYIYIKYFNFWADILYIIQI